MGLLDRIIKRRGKNGNKNLVVSNKKTRIDDNKYSGRKDIDSVVITEGVTRIGRSAFAGCINLKSVSLPNTLQVIEEDAFGRCESLTEIEFPHSLKEIHNSAFYSCRNLISIKMPKNLTYIANTAFFWSDNIVNIEFPDNYVVNPYAFRHCNKLNEKTKKQFEKINFEISEIKQKESQRRYETLAVYNTPEDDPGYADACNYDINKHPTEYRVAKNGERYIAIK